MSSRTYLVFLTRSAIFSAERAATRRSYTSVAGETIIQNWLLATAKKTSKPLSTSNPRHTGASKESNPQYTKRFYVSARVTVKKGDPNLEKRKETTLQDEIQGLEDIRRYTSLVPTTDIWGQNVRSLDVMIPCTIVSPRLRSNGLKTIWYQFWKNRQNDLKNMISLVALAKENALPGVNTRNDSFFRKFFLWPLCVFSTTSTRPTSWLAQTRQMCLEIHNDLCTAIAKNNLKEIKRLTTSSFASETLTTQKKHKVDCSYFWRFHREINPTQIVSLRATEGYLASEAPKFGNRLMVHALVKFDTEQSLEIYDRGGNPLHEPAEGSVCVNGRVPAKTRHVVQYLVFEKRMWYDGPWVIREQIWDIVPKKTD